MQFSPVPSRKRKRNRSEDDDEDLGNARQVRQKTAATTPPPVPGLAAVPAPTYAYPAFGDHRQPKQQVKYGPGEGLDDAQQQRVRQHLYGNQGPALKDSLVKKRLTQYSPDHATYVGAARATGRNLTVQESESEKTGANASHASINHVIASGVGQNTLNTGIAQFTRAKRDFDELSPLSEPLAGEAATKRRRRYSGLSPDRPLRWGGSRCTPARSPPSRPETGGRIRRLARTCSSSATTCSRPPSR